MALGYCCFQCLFCMIHFVNITDLTLSKLRYLIFAKSKLLSACSHFDGQSFSFCWTLCTNMLLFWYPLVLSLPQHQATHCIDVLAMLQLSHILPYAGYYLWDALYCSNYCCQSFYCILLSIVMFMSVPFKSQTLLSSLIWSSTSFCTHCASTLWPTLIFDH